MDETPAHDQKVTHRYTVHYPEHEPRESDPHYRDFDAYRRKTHATAKCAFGVRTGDFTQCHGPLELHHTHIEFALQNGVDLQMLEHQYPGVGDPDSVGAWVESAQNLTYYCRWHHRGPGGVHCASSADFEGEHFVRGLIS